MSRIVLLLALSFVLRATPAAVRGTLLDPSRAPVPNATVRLAASVYEFVALTDATGTFHLSGIPRGSYTLTVTADGFSSVRSELTVADQPIDLTLQCQPATLAQEFKVSAGTLTGSGLSVLPGSAHFLSQQTLLEARVFNTDEVLRKLPGLNTRSEEGWSLRPNIGIRGLNPTRSTRVLLLEDGMPLSYAPYGDNASYYHPPIERFDGVEVLKGAGQIGYGPMTVGGVVNYLTPAIPDKGRGTINLTGGNLSYWNGHAQYGRTFGRIGLLADALRKQGEGARENTRHGLTDLNTKAFATLKANQSLTLKFNRYEEDSQITYSGLREAEWLLNPRANPFRNDAADFVRYGASAGHAWAVQPDFVVTTNAYSALFFRDWWRQSSNSNQRPNDPTCGGLVNLNTTCGNEGRLRSYYTWGFDPRARAGWNLLGHRQEADFGFRYHDETQDRLQINAPTPTGRTGRTVENNQRIARAWSGYFQNRFSWRRLVLTPGLRFEGVRYRRTNFLLNAPSGIRGATRLNQWIPGLGLAYTPHSRFTFFTGIHRGFVPPRVEDIINNTTGQALELDPELSWNYELGFRARPSAESQLEATYFRMDFSNQVVPASVAGGIGATLINGGRTLHEGLELGGRHTWRNLFGAHSLTLRAAHTYVVNAQFRDRRFSTVPGSTAVLVTGNRLPYSPGHLLNASVSYTHRTGWNALLEGVYTGRQFADDLNSINPTPDGQRGAIPSNIIFHATANVPLEAWRTDLFVTTKNAFDRLYIADRSRGLLPGMPRQIQAGLRWRF
jgi:Fe(3+) dicitrate transport protein